MEQFSLSEYLKNPTRPIVTRGGRSVRIICTDRESDNYPVVALIQEHRYEDTCHYTKDGLFLNGTENRNDLFFAPEKKEGWVNLFKINSTITTGEVYNTKEEAKSAVKNTAVINSSIYISTVKVEWEE